MSAKLIREFKEGKIHIFYDQQIISKKTVDYLDIEEYCVKTISGWKIPFVGFIIQNDSLIISFPKKYIDNLENIEVTDIELLIKLYEKVTVNSPLYWDEQEVQDSFPLKEYLNICNYYLSKGFYVSEVDSNHFGYSGRINWKKTFSNSPNFIQDGHVQYLPLVISKKNNIETIVTNAMKFVLADGYNKVGELFDLGVPYFDEIMYRKISYERIISQLKQLKLKTFSDYEVHLLNSLISYFEWSSGRQRDITLLTYNFEDIWQIIVNYFINNNMNQVLGLSKYTKNIRIDNKNINGKYAPHNIQKNDGDGKKSRSVEYDFLAIDDKHIFLFDSKYKEDADKNLDYKQFAYHFLVRLFPGANSEKRIINALISPTMEANKSTIHLDLTEHKSKIDTFKDLMILIFYLNTKEVMTFYMLNKM